MTEHVEHSLIPGSRECANGGQCHCGSQWDCLNNRCAKQSEEIWQTEHFRYMNFMVALGEHEGYLGVENLFNGVEVSFMENTDTKNKVTLDIDDVKKLIQSLQVVVDGYPTFGGGPTR